MRWSVFRLKLVFALDRKLFPGLRQLLQSILVIWLSHQLCQFAAFVRIYSVFGHGAHGSPAWGAPSIFHIHRLQKSIRPVLTHRTIRANPGVAGFLLRSRRAANFGPIRCQHASQLSTGLSTGQKFENRQGAFSSVQVPSAFPL